MAERASRQPPEDPWDSGCRVTTFVSGFDAMSAMRETLKTVIGDVEGKPDSERGHVYICGWRFNCLRDLSAENPWKLDPWTPFMSGTQATLDQTAIGLVLRLLQARVAVRLLVWLPTRISELELVGFAPHVLDHVYAARLIDAESRRVTPSADPPLGLAALDMRTANVESATHHQKMMVIRSVNTHVAFAGGVDLAFTRRDAPGTPRGDWQSGKDIPGPAGGWPRQPGVDYTETDKLHPANIKQSSDLPEEIYGAKQMRHRWHDQHLMLEGPIVTTIEWQFAERWRDWGHPFDLSKRANWNNQQVIFSSGAAFDATAIKPLKPDPQPTASPAGATSRVQMWRTIPLRRGRVEGPFQRGEFTVMAGIAHAVKAAQELIWIFDQYMWSDAFARLLNEQLKARETLHVIIVLPPHADTAPLTAHEARFRALTRLTDGVLDRVAVYDMWNGAGAAILEPSNRGIYVHAKSHTYDGALLVCGSANINRRSFLCDTELVCAVLDPAVVLSHQRTLWSRLFGDDTRPATRPNIDLQTAGAGKELFDAFTTAARDGPSILIPDPWRTTTPRLPNNRDRLRSPLAYSSLYNAVVDPSAVAPRLEGPVFRATGELVEPTLADVVKRLEAVFSPSGRFPYRQPL
jgi:phosphatidylserine/phosphatidylglycerophosphate/cardiolipin synthase-like enzyme